MTTQALNFNSRPESLLNFGGTKRLPMILQTEAAECGLACLAMVAGFHGLETDLTTLRRKYSISAQGATLKQIMAIAGHMNLTSRALKLEIEHLSQLQTPCILHWEMKHFVVLKQVQGNKAVIHDPGVGERHLFLDEVSQCFTGVALELLPSSQFTPGVEKNKLRFEQFWSNINGLKRSLGLLILLSLLLQVFAIVSPYYMQTVVDDVLMRSDSNLLSVLAIGFGLLLVIEAGTSLLRQVVVLNLSNRLNMQMSANVFHHLIRLPMDYFIKRHMGDVISRFGSLNNIRELMTNGIVSVFIDGVMALITLVVMFVYDLKLTFIVLAVVTLYALLRVLLYRPVRRLSEEHIVATAKENSHFMESVRAIQTIKLFDKESDRQNQWQNYLAESINKGIRISKWQIGFDTANKILFGLENILIIYFAATAVMGNLMSVGMLYAFMSYKNRFIGAMDTLISKAIEFKMLDLHFERLADVVYSDKDPACSLPDTDLASGVADKSLQGHLMVTDLSYSYSELEAPILQSINMQVEAGETVAIVGASGSGKSTLLRCLMGLSQPTGGSIEVDGKLISQWPDYRQQISGVLQDDQLLSGSIADNIACFESQIDYEKVVLCAQLACIHEEVMQTAMQYNTLVGDMGASLSGGQKQRILLARAFYRHPKILFMDEATSHLDVDNESRINAHIKQLNMTRVIIAHRPETIKTADRVYALSEGRMHELPAERH